MATRTDTKPALHGADSHDLIRVQGARENNLKDVSIEIAKRRLTVFTGVSGSGKSSLVFDTIAAESQRMINETYSAFVQGFMPTLSRPEVDFLDGLTTAIIVDQERMGSNPRSTVGTATDANAMLRILFSRLGKPHIGSPNAYSFNVPSVRGSGAITVERGAKTKTEKATFTMLGGADLHRVGFPGPRQAGPAIHQEGAPRLPLRRTEEGEDQQHQPDLRGTDPQGPEVVSVQGRRRASAAHPRVRGACGDLHDMSRVRGHPIEPGGAVVEDRGEEHRRRLRGDRTGIPLARPAVGHAVRRRVTAHQDDPSPRLVAHGRHLRLRRAHDRL